MTSTTLLAASKRTRRSLAWLWPIGGLALLIATLGQLIGPMVIPVGFAAITILPMVWGILAGVFNSIPYFGPTVVAIAALVTSFIQFGSVWQATIVSMASLVITTIEGMVITPLLVSRLARMNPVAVFLGCSSGAGCGASWECCSRYRC